MKVLVVFGTRPEAIKMLPLVNKLKEADGIECTVCLTGQHREMLTQVMDAFGINMKDVNTLFGQRTTRNSGKTKLSRTLPEIKIIIVSCRNKDGILLLFGSVNSNRLIAKKH